MSHNEVVDSYTHPVPMEVVQRMQRAFQPPHFEIQVEPSAACCPNCQSPACVYLTYTDTASKWSFVFLMCLHCWQSYIELPEYALVETADTDDAQ